MKIKEVAELTGITVRTLHYYDEIGLLRPGETTKSGYRIYGEEELERLQQILFFRELDFPLNEIKDILENSAFDKEEALRKHRQLLNKKKERLDRLIRLVDNSLKGEKTMSFKEFDMTEIENAKKKYAEETKERWGHTDAYEESRKRTEGYGKEQWKRVWEGSASIFEGFAKNREKAPDSAEALALVKEWQDFITANFYTCTREILAGLGQMYVNDVRFTENIDQYGEGTAKFMAEAIEVYCSR